MNQLSEARRHIVLRYLWIDRRDLCANEAEREYYDTLTRSLSESTSGSTSGPSGERR